MQNPQSQKVKTDAGMVVDFKGVSLKYVKKFKKPNPAFTPKKSLKELFLLVI